MTVAADEEAIGALEQPTRGEVNLLACYTTRPDFGFASAFLLYQRFVGFCTVLAGCVFWRAAVTTA